LLPEIDNFHREQGQFQLGEGMRSCGMAAQILMLASKAMHYYSWPTDGVDFAAVGELINLPEGHAIAMFVAIGKTLNTAHPYGGQLVLNEVVIKHKL
jgi:nitroreductase